MSKRWQTLVIVLYKITFDLVYIYFTSKVFNYMNSKLVFDVTKYIIGWFFFIILLVLFQILLYDSLNSFFFKIMFLLSGVPGLSLFGMLSIDMNKYILTVIYWFFMILAFSVLQNKKKFFLSSNLSLAIKDHPTFYNILLMISAVSTIYFWMKYGNFRIITSLFDVYEYRFLFRNAEMNTILRYLFVWTGNVFLPYLFAVFLVKRQWSRNLLVLFCGILFFSIDGMKTRIILYALILFTTLLFRKTNRYDKVISTIGFSLSITGLLALIFYKLLNISSLGALYHRTFSVPAELGYKYLDFFANNPKLYLSESILKSFISAPYSVLSSFIIGSDTSSAVDAINANTGMVGDSYANFGFLGTIIYPFMIAFSFTIFDFFSRKQDRIVVTCVSLIVIWYLINASFFTWLLTGGFMIYIFIFILSDANKEVENYEKRNN